jgi:hypothetical protein
LKLSFFGSEFNLRCFKKLRSLKLYSLCSTCSTDSKTTDMPVRVHWRQQVTEPPSEFEIATRCLDKLQAASTCSTQHLDAATMLMEGCISSFEMQSHVKAELERAQVDNPVPAKKDRKRRRPPAKATEQTHNQTRKQEGTQSRTTEIPAKNTSKRRRPPAKSSNVDSLVYPALSDWPSQEPEHIELDDVQKLILSSNLGI